MNLSHTDPWHTVKLVPAKGANLKKYAKRKRLDIALQQIQQQASTCDQSEHDNISYIYDSNDEELDEKELPEIVFEENDKVTNRRRMENKSKNFDANKKKSVISVTDAITDSANADCEDESEAAAKMKCSWISVAEEIQC